MRAETERLRVECERLELALTVALRRETERALEAQRHEFELADERQALAAVHEALEAQAASHAAAQQQAEAAIEASKARAAALRQSNLERAETVEALREERDQLRQANLHLKAEAAAATAAASATVARGQATAAAASVAAANGACTPTTTVANGACTSPQPSSSPEVGSAASSNGEGAVSVRRHKMAVDSARRRARVSERRALAAELEARLVESSVMLAEAQAAAQAHAHATSPRHTPPTTADDARQTRVSSAPGSGPPYALPGALGRRAQS
jgi:hypothetical protein